MQRLSSVQKLTAFFSPLVNFLIPPPLHHLEPGSTNPALERQRERILTAMLRATCLLGFLALLVGLPSLIEDNQWSLIVIYPIFFSILAVAALKRSAAYQLRAGIFLVMGYSLALAELVNYGLGEDGRIFLFGFSVAAIMLLGARIGIGALGLSTATILSVGWLLHTGQLALQSMHASPVPPSIELIVTTTVNFFMVTGLLMAALYTLLHDFEMAWFRERAAVTQLHQERDLLDQRVTERTRELAQARDQALAASQLKTELLAKVSHELRTPLGAILGFTEMLEGGVYGSIAPTQQPVTAEIIDSTKYLTSLVNELLDQSQLEAGKLKLNYSAFTPAALVDDTLAQIRVLAEAKDITLTSTISFEVPDLLWGDPVRLQQIMVNLVSNAVKFTRQGKIQIKLFCPDAAHWAIQVADTGVGIPPEAQIYIFEPFRQVDGSVTRNQVGAGLGLSIVKQLTALMGGQIILESKVNLGSTFTVILPIHQRI